MTDLLEPAVEAVPDEAHDLLEALSRTVIEWLTAQARTLALQVIANERSADVTRAMVAAAEAGATPQQLADSAGMSVDTVRSRLQHQMDPSLWRSVFLPSGPLPPLDPAPLPEPEPVAEEVEVATAPRPWVPVPPRPVAEEPVDDLPADDQDDEPVADVTPLATWPPAGFDDLGYPPPMPDVEEPVPASAEPPRRKGLFGSRRHEQIA